MEVINLKTSQISEAFTMNGGDGRYCYANNSTIQRSGIESSKAMIEQEIEEKLDIEKLPNTNTFRIVDLGCSVGPNTLIAVQNIIKAVDLKFKSQAISVPEFHVFFNDHSSNDFNTLFGSLPEGRGYFAAGVPGSFYTRLFPRASIHFVHSSTALQWLSEVPKGVVDIHSPAWNKGRIHYANAPNEVKEAYSAQFAKDMENFLRARAQELVCGGLMVILVLGVPNGTLPTQSVPCLLQHLLGSCLMDMVKMGIIDEAKVDEFNLPLYFPSPQEIEAVVEKDRCFSIERVEVMRRPDCNAKVYSNTIRAIMEPGTKQHFGSDEIIDELFHRFTNKIVDSPSILKSGTNNLLFFLLKRNGVNVSADTY
ncbi:SAM dependent carboxyl methyltransferase [Macleaya cordata]|uniref:SAM dependent carboxyl methyltransferase n=1 Tax=Macleaya cordata TaxID=56857 RepID=A0A200Q314_MACCD|nr:SAM dependent carboxyl methyltransferase [Macleaya cordata]